MILYNYILKRCYFRLLLFIYFSAPHIIYLPRLRVGDVPAVLILEGRGAYKYKINKVKLKSLYSSLGGENMNFWKVVSNKTSVFYLMFSIIYYIGNGLFITISKINRIIRNIFGFKRCTSPIVFETWIYNGWIKICKSCIIGKDKGHLMHWIRTDKVNWVCERGRFTTIKKLIVLPARYMIRYDYVMTIIIIRNYYYLLLSNG